METTAQDDLQYLRQIAEQGEKHPVHGGEFGILWGTLYLLASLYAYATLSGFLPFSNSTVAIAFILPIPIGTIGHYLLAKRFIQKSGAFSFGNRTSSAAWTTVGLSTFIIFLSIFAGKALHLLNLSEAVIWGLLQAVIFSMYSVAYGTTAQTSGDKVQYVYAGVGLAMAVATVFTIGQLEVFLVLAAGVFFGAVLPGIVSLRTS
ncbi:MAG: hypothetical protein ACPG5J_13460 [Pseudomonadales bacterium]